MKRIIYVFVCLLAAVTVAQAQTDCENMLKAADEYNNKGDYKKAAKMYRLIKEECSNNYGGVETKIKDCNRKLKEAQQKQSDAQNNIRETDRIRAKEDEAYLKCTSETACDEYLEAYPNGRYYVKVLQMKEQFEEEEREAAKTAYMTIRNIEFANTDKEGNILNPYGFAMYSSEIRYLKPRIVYDGILDESMFVRLFWKIIAPDGSLKTSANSPSGYTYSDFSWVQPGTGNLFQLSGMGNSEGGVFGPGNYRFELWYEDAKIYNVAFVVKEMENALLRGVWRTALEQCCEIVMKRYDNSSYKGQLYDGSRSGLGMYSWNDGDYYIGGWKSGSKEGRGIYIIGSSGYVRNCPDCIYYVGGWSSSAKSGTGTCYDKFGNLIYEGGFADDKPTGSYPMTGYDSYKFECKEYSNGAYYVGETYNGKRHGKGIYIWSSGDMWYGDWNNGERDGYGIYMPYQGSVSTGTWKGDTKQ